MISRWVSAVTRLMVKEGKLFMPNKNQHVVKHSEGWAVRGAGNSRITGVYSTQAEATHRAREIAQNQESEMFIHGRDGKIRERNSYGNDPFPPKG